MRSTISRVGKYELRAELARTSFSTVYDGWDSDIARRVAIKIMPAAVTGGSEAREVFVRFKRGAQAAGQLNHPNIVAVHDYGETEDYAYLVMEFVDGPTLKHKFDDDHRFNLAAIGKIIGGVLEALQYSHDRAVVHRDVKPANIMFTKDDRVKITDFGIARLEDSEMTQTGMVIGTPAYMSPEQFLGQKVDLRTDIYSTGVVLYHLLTGERPYEGNLTTIMHKVLYGSPPIPSRLSSLATSGMDAIVSRAMARNPQDRFASAAEFNAALQALLVPGGRKIGSAGASFADRSYPARQSPAKAFSFSLRTGLAAVLAAALIAAGGVGAWYSYDHSANQKVQRAARDAPVPSNDGRNGHEPATDGLSVAPPANPASAPKPDQPDRLAVPDNQPPTQQAIVTPPEVRAPDAEGTDPYVLPPPAEPVQKAGPQHASESSPPSNKKPVAAAGNAKTSSGSEAAAGRTNPDRRAAPVDGGTGPWPPDSTDHADLNLNRKNPPVDDSSANIVRRLRADLGRRANPAAEPAAPAPLYATTSASSIGLLCQTVTAETAARLGMDTAQGMLVTGVAVGSAAAQAGIRPDDVILKIKGSEARELSVLSAVAAATPVGQTVPIEILRQGAHQVLQLQVDQLRH